MANLLESLYQFEFSGNSLDRWFYAVASAIVVFLVLKLAFRTLQNRLEILSRKTSTVADDLVAAALGSTHILFTLVAAVWAGARFLNLGRFDMHIDFGLLVVVVLQLAIWANRMVSAYISFYTLSRKDDNPGAVSVVQGISFLLRLIIWSVALLLVIENLGYDITALVAGLGIGGITVALALQNILSDLFASLSIVLDKPFVVGDFIIVDELMGVVQRVGLKTTRVKSLSGEQLIFSNSDLLNSRVRNYKRMQERRIAFAFGVLYQTSAEQLEKIPEMVREIIEAIENARFDRAHFRSFGSSSYDFEVVYYVLSSDYVKYMDIQQSINLALVRCFAAEGVEFAYPTRTIYMHQAEGEGS